MILNPVSEGSTSQATAHSITPISTGGDQQNAISIADGPSSALPGEIVVLRLSLVSDDGAPDDPVLRTRGGTVLPCSFSETAPATRAAPPSSYVYIMFVMPDQDVEIVF